MTKNSDLLKSFFECVSTLKTNNIIKSDRFLGDIGEYIIEKKYGVVLSKNKREKYIDGMIGESSVQIKYNSSPTKTNIEVGDPTKYEILYLILAKQSLHFPPTEVADFIVYTFTSEIILSNVLISKKGRYNFTRNSLAKYPYEKIDFQDLD